MNRPNREKMNRFMLWIDAVGGYLVCVGDRSVIGRPVATDEQYTAMADVPIFADLARQHATIVREGESHLIESERPTTVGGREVRAAAALTDGCTIGLGEAVQLRFSKPHALSATARLEIISGHSTEPRTTGVLLMADTCILGPTSDCHVVCADWTTQIVLLRHNGQLFCRTTGLSRIGRDEQASGRESMLMVDDVPTDERRVRLRSGSRVTGPGITAFTVEAV